MDAHAGSSSAMHALNRHANKSDCHKHEMEYDIIGKLQIR